MPAFAYVVSKLDISATVSQIYQDQYFQISNRQLPALPTVRFHWSPTKTVKNSPLKKMNRPFYTFHQIYRWQNAGLQSPHPYTAHQTNLLIA